MREDAAILGHQLGIDPEAALGPRIVSWVAWFVTVLLWLAALTRDSWPTARLAIAATVVSVAISIWVMNVRRALRARQERAIEREVAWSKSSW